jgi:hypothetical protein
MKNEADATELIEDREERDIAKLVAATVGWFGLTSGKRVRVLERKCSRAL